MSNSEDFVLDQELPSENNAILYAVPTTKFILLYLCTFGLYPIYWFYKSWWSIREQTGDNISPVWRAIFSPFWAYSCFKSIKDFAEAHGKTAKYLPGPMAVLYFLGNILSNLPAPYFLLFLISGLAMIPFNSLSAKVNQARTGNYMPDEKYSIGEWAVIVIGGIIFLMIIVGSFLPE